MRFRYFDTNCLVAQRGVAALMAVLFLLFLLGVVLVIANQMAASDVHDSGAQNLSVEALYLAESGIGRASRRYRDNGALCAGNGLVEGPFTIVAGSNRQFRIVSSAGNATTCTVDVRGEIGDIEREVRVILQRTAGGGVLVDPTFDNPGIWDGDNNVVGGGVATFSNPFAGATRDELEARRPNAIDTTAFTANVNIAMAVSFNFTVVGNLDIEIRVRLPGADRFYNLNNITTGSGTVSLASLGAAFDPTDIQRIDITINDMGNGESVVIDNLYIGPAVGGAATIEVSEWTEIVP